MFVDVGDQNNGYRVFRAKLPGEASWAWLTANSTRRGFVRATDREYAALSKCMPEEALRHPEYPDCAWFFSSTDFASGVGVAMVKAIGTLPYQTRLVTLA